MPAQHQTGSLRSGDVQIFYRQLGRPGKTPVIFIHGASYFSYDWIDVANAVAVDREAVAMDMRGFGGSSWSPSKDYSVPTMAGDIWALAAHLGWSKVILVGHSMGGRSVAWCAAKHPELVRACVLVDYSPDNAPGGSKRTAERVGRQPDLFDSVEDAMRYHGLAPESDAGRSKRARFEAFLKPVAGGYQLRRDLYFRDQFRRVLETGERPKLGVDMWQTLADLKCPTLVIRGSESDMFLAETVPKMKAANAKIHVVDIPAGHNVAGDDPERFVATVRAFLGSLEENHVKPS